MSFGKDFLWAVQLLPTNMRADGMKAEKAPVFMMRLRAAM